MIFENTPHTTPLENVRRRTRCQACTALRGYVCVLPTFYFATMILIPSNFLVFFINITALINFIVALLGRKSVAPKEGGGDAKERNRIALEKRKVYRSLLF